VTAPESKACTNRSVVWFADTRRCFARLSVFLSQ